ncbi:MAG: hypothetical protein HY562_11225 [Ignavibacteriales bacterium]|nr:hypothetical protein [Ignavibacteriales bacterium]
MTTPATTPRKEISVLFLGILFIVLGLALFLDRLNVVTFGSGRFVWTAVAAFGAVLIVLAFVRRNRKSLFWGNLLLFFGGCVALYHWHVIPRGDFYILPLFSIALGLSFFTSYLYNPGNFVILVPATIFTGFGVVFYLWWWEYIDWFDLRSFARTYWPLLLIALGLGMALRHRSGR